MENTGLTSEVVQNNWLNELEEIDISFKNPVQAEEFHCDFLRDLDVIETGEIEESIILLDKYTVEVISKPSSRNRDNSGKRSNRESPIAPDIESRNESPVEVGPESENTSQAELCSEIVAQAAMPILAIEFFLEDSN